MSSKTPIYLLTALAAASLLLFTLLANAEGASAQQAVDNTPTSTSTPGAMAFRSISAGVYITCGIRTDGSAVCWGRLPPRKADVPLWQAAYLVDQPRDETFASITAGTGSDEGTICGLRADGTSVCWGYTGYGLASPPADETFASIGIGDRHACGLRKTDGVAVCWGSSVHNAYGQLTPPAGETFTSISVGYNDSCGLRSNGTAVCWGFYSSGYYDSPSPVAAPADETFTSISVGVAYACGLRSDGTALCWGNPGGSDYGQATPPADETFASISAGMTHTCGLRKDSTVVCWGNNDSGESTPPSGAFSSISAGLSYTCGLRTNGTAVCWGYNGYGEASPPVEYTPTPTGTPSTTTPTLTPTFTSVSATDEPTPTPTSTSVTAEPTPITAQGVAPTLTPTSTSVSSTDEPTPTQAPTHTPTATPTGEERLTAFEEQVEPLREQVGTLQDAGRLQRLIEALHGLINALTNRTAELGGDAPTATPTATPTTVVAVEATPTATPTSAATPESTATPTPSATPVATLPPGCITRTGLGWLTGTWNADCLSTRTPATAKTGTRYARFYTFTLDTAATVTVEITSNDVAHAYLYLLNGVGRDGSVVNRGDARISDTLAAGSYTIEATTYDLETSGNFMLTLDIQSQPPATSN